MALGNTQSINAMRNEIWQKELYQDVMDDLYFMKNGLMGDGTNNIVQTKSQLKKSQGDTITFGLTAKLSGNGVTGDSELEGQEEAIAAYSQSIVIDQIRNAVRLTGKLDEQFNAYDMRSDAKEKLATWAKEFIERNIFLKMAGITVTSMAGVYGTVDTTRSTWSNSAPIVPAADEAAGSGSRYICAKSTGIDAIASTDILTPALISRARIKAKLANPIVRPLRVEGKDYYVMFIHPNQAYDLKNASGSTWASAQRDAQVRGDSNPLFTGALGIWDGVILFDHEYVPTLIGDGSTTVFSVGATAVANGAYVARAMLCGQQAMGFAQTQDSFNMVEKAFNYENQMGYATGLIGGIQKIQFNSLDYGVITVDTGVTAL